MGEKGSIAYEIVLSHGKRPNDLPVLAVKWEWGKDDEGMVRPLNWDEIGDELLVQ